MTKKINLHLGFHRTATSSFQSTCYTNFNLLEKQNIFYPKFSNIEDPLKPIHNHSPALCSIFLTNPKEYKLNKRYNKIEQININFENTLDRALSTNTNIVISGEGLSTLKEKELEKLIYKLASKGHVINPFAVIRSPYSVFCSSISARVKRGEHINFNTFRKGAGDLPLKRISKLKGFFGDNIKFIPFKKTLAFNNGPVCFLLDYIGVKNLEKFNIIQKHQSMTNFNVRIQNMINKFFPVESKVYNLENFKFNKYKENAKFRLSSSEMSIVKDLLDKENDFLKNVLDLSFCDEFYDTCDDDINDQIQRYLLNKLKEN